VGRSRARRPPPGPGGAEVRVGPVVPAVTVGAAVSDARGSVRVPASLAPAGLAGGGAGGVCVGAAAVLRWPWGLKGVCAPLLP